ncbi:hypothetical protein NE237_027010 [Protea cynaroides]|uniref:Uncharacterized protein n=1 Tax=Protea cynaroides TaxID=273540 RepID=A0A9Q0JU09_9MAGN|nr:hypothetical protein NE237_027010 [Protea cynaroides]
MEDFPKDNDEETAERKAEAACSSSFRCSHSCSFLEKAIRDFLKCLGIDHERTPGAPPEQEHCSPNQPSTQDPSSSSPASDENAVDPPSRPSIDSGSPSQTN